MSLIRYQSPDLAAWPPFDRWITLRDDLNTLFELPFWSNFGRQSQLFSGWSPALDLYQNNDDVIAVVELPGMRKEDIQISLHDGTLTISGERKSETSDGQLNEPNVTSASFAAVSRYRPGSTPAKLARLIGMAF